MFLILKSVSTRMRRMKKLICFTTFFLITIRRPLMAHKEVNYLGFSHQAIETWLFHLSRKDFLCLSTLDCDVRTWKKGMMINWRWNCIKLKHKNFTNYFYLLFFSLSTSPPSPPTQSSDDGKEILCRKSTKGKHFSDFFLLFIFFDDCNKLNLTKTNKSIGNLWNEHSSKFSGTTKNI